MSKEIIRGYILDKGEHIVSLDKELSADPKIRSVKIIKKSSGTSGAEAYYIIIQEATSTSTPMEFELDSTKIPPDLDD